MAYTKKGKKEYGMLMLPSDAHKMLKDYCDKHGFKLSGFVAALIRQHIYGKKD